MRVCILLIPNKQLSEAPLDGAVGVGALADIFNCVDVSFQVLAVTFHVSQLVDHDHFVTIVQGSRVPRQDAVTSVASGEAQVLVHATPTTLACSMYKSSLNYHYH